VDVSQRAVEISRRRAPEFLPEGRAEFVQATFERTGLPSGCADGAVSVDALPFAFDKDAALAELRRILRPGARAVFTGGRKLPGHPSYEADEPSWPERVAQAGLELEAEIERPDEPDLWERLFAGVLEHETQIRAELPEEGARLLYDEVSTVGSKLRTRIATLLTVRRPLTD
jgi:SAM-dependent methyltransferase